MAPRAAPPPIVAEVIDAERPGPSGVPCVSCGCPVEETDHFCPACGTLNHAARVPPAPASTSSGTSRTHDKSDSQHTFPASVSAPADDSVPAAAAATGVHLRCETCGAEVRVEHSQRSYRCAFCDSNYVVECPAGDGRRQGPEFIIGFAVTREQARESFEKWIRANAWFNPGDLSVGAVAEKQCGVYLPFWSFPMLAESRWQAEIGEHWQRTETYTTTVNGKRVTRTRTVTETEWWPLSGRHHRFHVGYLVSGSKGLPQEQTRWIQPFQLPALKRYEPWYLAGWQCEEYSVERETALAHCQEAYQQRETQAIRDFLPGDTARLHDVQTQFRHISSDLCLLPVYVLSYRYQDKVYRFLVNGQTGRFGGEKPVSWQRIAVAVVGGLILLGALGLITLRFLSR